MRRMPGTRRRNVLVSEVLLMRLNDLSANDLAMLCGYLSKKTGMILDDNRKEQLCSSVRSRMEAAGLDAFSDYYQRLALSPGDDSEFKALMDLFTIKETAFFRHHEQFKVLREFCLPRLMAARSQQKTLRIWSAGCSFGEEPYSIAMAIRDRISSASNWDVRIWATDISQEALESAKRGVYQERSLRGVDARYLKRYFSARQDCFSVCTEIRQMVTFDYFNLAADYSVPPLGHFWDIIFCRNVIIYLSKEHIKQVLNKFHGSLADDGYLFPGYSEILRYHSDDFVSVEVHGTFVYRKRRPDDGPVMRVKGPTSKSITWQPSKQKSAGEPRHPGAVHSDRIKKKVKREEESRLNVDPSPNRRHQSQKEEKIDPTPDLETPLDSIELAKRMAEQGQTQRAIELLRDVLERSSLNVSALNALAVIWQNLEDADRCIQYFKKSLYLESDQPMVYLHLADAYRTKGKIKEARREYANVIRLLETDSMDDSIEALQGFSKEMILETARSHLRVLLASALKEA